MQLPSNNLLQQALLSNLLSSSGTIQASLNPENARLRYPSLVKSKIDTYFSRLLSWQMEFIGAFHINRMYLHIWCRPATWQIRHWGRIWYCLCRVSWSWAHFAFAAMRVKRWDMHAQTALVSIVRGRRLNAVSVTEFLSVIDDVCPPWSDAS